MFKFTRNIVSTLVQTYFIHSLLYNKHSTNNISNQLNERHLTVSVSLYKSKYGCKDQESIQSSTTPDPGYKWESDKLTVDTTNESQEVSPFPAGDHKAHNKQMRTKTSGGFMGGALGASAPPAECMVKKS